MTLAGGIYLETGSSTIDTGELFHPYAEQAVMRLRYLYPEAVFLVNDGTITVTVSAGGDPDAIARETRFQLYREKIYQEGLPLRARLYQAILE